MKTSKTLKLIRQFHEALEDGGQEQPQQDPNAQPSPDATENPEPTPEETMPMTSEGENQYISDLVDAALFAPSAEDAQTLLNLQSVMKLKRFTNAREEVLPTILSIISSSTQAKDLKSDLNNI